MLWESAVLYESDGPLHESVDRQRHEAAWKVWSTSGYFDERRSDEGGSGFVTGYLEACAHESGPWRSSMGEANRGNS